MTPPKPHSDAPMDGIERRGSRSGEIESTEAEPGQMPPRQGEGFYWRSLEALASGDEPAPGPGPEFAPGAEELVLDGVERRQFLGVMGASLAMAGVGLSGCVRKPREHILPYARRPELLVPGQPRYFATAAQIGGGVLGLLVESQEGRPTKIEGNRSHPMSLGATNAWAQAEVLSLYDPQRSRQPRRSGERAAFNWQQPLWESFTKELDQQLEQAAKREGQGLALLIRHRTSPTFQGLIADLRKKYPKVGIYVHDAAYPANALAATRLVGAAGTLPLWDLSRSQVTVALDADLFGTERDSVWHARKFADGRRMRDQREGMNRLYAADPALTVTSSMAEHRLAVKGSEIGRLAKALAAEVLSATGARTSDAVSAALRDSGLSEPQKRWVRAVALDLAAHRGQSLVCVGERQPAWVHAVAHLINDALGNLGKTVSFVPQELVEARPLAELAREIAQGRVDALVIVGGNPVYEAPAELSFAKLMRRVKWSVHHGQRVDETGSEATWHLPATHFLESWGDHRASDGTLSIQQPLIAPLHRGARSEIELLARLVGNKSSAHDLVRARHSGMAAAARFEESWRRWLHDGLIAGSTARPLTPRLRWETLPQAIRGGSAAAAKASSGGSVELVVTRCSSVYDGRYANNAWLQELPDPITKLTWDNAALISPKTAERLKLENGDLVEITAGKRKLADVPVWVTPGIADATVVLADGYGRTAAGEVGNDVGVDVAPLRPAPGIVAVAVGVKKVGGGYELASTQDYGRLEVPFTGVRRPVFREATLAEYRDNPDFVEEDEVLEPDKIKSLFRESHVWKQPGAPKLQQWGMSIDLNVCVGCSACTVACQAENNIPVVGKERVLMGREMHWIRVDRYFTGPAEEPAVAMQPVPCMQCENAPCETVCPVAATAHSPEGLNDMAYNRCIGTRYCSNNCPYKVRRFNYFNFQKENDHRNPLLAMQRNPDVTVRFRGVMEKCTYCVQRITAARSDAKRHGTKQVVDGVIVPACAQACPTEAIVFGDVSDPQSRVSLLKARDRNYALLSELNTKPRTTYLARLRNVNPALARETPKTGTTGKGAKEHG